MKIVDLTLALIVLIKFRDFAKLLRCGNEILANLYG